MKKLLLICSLLIALPASAKEIRIDIDELNAWEPFGNDSHAPVSITEKIIGRADFIKVRDLPQDDPNRALSAKVGQFLNLDGGVCSGSLVGPDLFLTNHHCVYDDDKKAFMAAEKIAVAMEHLQNKDLGPKGSLALGSKIEAANRALDFALIRLDRRLGDRYGWLEVEREKRQIDNFRAVKIIQHPAGRSKEIVVSNTAVVNCREPVKSNDPYMCYMADTEGGSSGSPVFGLEGQKLIALHHAGLTNRFNIGTPASYLYEHLQAFLPASQAVAQPAAAPPASQPTAKTSAQKKAAAQTPKKPASKQPKGKPTPAAPQPKKDSDDWEPVT